MLERDGRTGGCCAQAQRFRASVARAVLASDLGGEVHLEFAPQGLVCTIDVPYPRGAPDEPRRPMRVLVVEDEFLVALQIEDDLVAAGYSVIGRSRASHSRFPQSAHTRSISRPLT